MLDLQELNDKKIKITYADQIEKTVYKPFFYKHLRNLKQAKNSQEFLNLFDSIEYQRALDYVLWLLGRTAYSTQQLRSKLKEKCISQETQDAVLQKCLNYGYIQDEDIAKAHMRRELLKGYGPRLMIPKLSFKLGISKEALSEIFASEDFSDELETGRQKIIAKIQRKGSSSYEIKAHLIKRGFDY
ncbi:MAG: RecX family transcriptional regulator [Simkaniaceae bacterium]|nr:RecX family transcriptional regulator [Simkaniaceae bacterium]